MSSQHSLTPRRPCQPQAGPRRIGSSTVPCFAASQHTLAAAARSSAPRTDPAPVARQCGRVWLRNGTQTTEIIGVVAHDVASRRPELALRIALGANQARIVAATPAQGALMVGARALVGGILSVWAARALGAVIVTHTSLDVVSVTIAAAVIVGLGVAAVLPVARRAARTDPLIALRSE